MPVERIRVPLDPRRKVLLGRQHHQRQQISEGRCHSRHEERRKDLRASGGWVGFLSRWGWGRRQRRWRRIQPACIQQAEGYSDNGREATKAPRQVEGGVYREEARDY